jgi:hypothetical protein
VAAAAAAPAPPNRQGHPGLLSWRRCGRSISSSSLCGPRSRARSRRGRTR